MFNYRTDMAAKLPTQCTPDLGAKVKVDTLPLEVPWIENRN